MADCGPIPKPRNPGDRQPAEVPRADVEHAIAVALHDGTCAGNDAYPPDMRRADMAGHAIDAQTICDLFTANGWTITRRNRA